MNVYIYICIFIYNIVNWGLQIIMGTTRGDRGSTPMHINAYKGGGGV